VRQQVCRQEAAACGQSGVGRSALVLRIGGLRATLWRCARQERAAALEQALDGARAKAAAELGEAAQAVAAAERAAADAAARAQAAEQRAAALECSQDRVAQLEAQLAAAQARNTPGLQAVGLSVCRSRKNYFLCTCLRQQERITSCTRVCRSGKE
jgi:hypothetical protein